MHDMSLEFSKKSFFSLYISISLILYIISIFVQNNHFWGVVISFLELLFFIGFFMYSGLKMKKKSFDFKKIVAFSAITSGVTSVLLEIISFIIFKTYLEPKTLIVKGITQNKYILILLVSIIIEIIFYMLISILFSYLGAKLHKSDYVVLSEVKSKKNL